MADDNEGLQAEIGITVAKIARQLADVETRMVKTAKKIEAQFNASNGKAAGTFKKIDDASGRTAINVGRMAGVLAGAFSVRELQRYADGWTNAGNMIAAASQMAGKGARSLSAINDIADDARSSLGATAALYAKLLRSTANLPASEKDVALATELVAKSFKAGGAAASEAEGAINQLGQALSSGRLSGDELNSLLENAPVLAQAIADEFGVTIGKLKELGKEGQLTADRVFAAILKAQPKIEAAFATTNSTIADGMTRLSNALTEYVGLGDQATGTTEKIVSALNFLADNIDLVVAAGLILTGRFLGPLAGKLLIDLAKNARIAATGIGAIGTSATLAARGAGALRLVMGALGGPIGILITALTLLPMLITDTGEAIDLAKTAAENGEAALDAYAEASKRAADEQDGLAGKVSAATAQMVIQTRAGLQRALEDAIKARDELVGKLSDGTFLNGALRIISQQTYGIGGEGFGNKFIAEMSKAFGDLADGTRTDLGVVVDRLHAIEGAGLELVTVLDQLDLAKLDPQNVDLAGARNKTLELAKAVGLFGEELAALDAAKTPDEAAKAWDVLEKRMREAGEAGNALRGFVDKGTDALLTSAVAAGQEVDRLTAGLSATGDELDKLAEKGSPFEEIADDASRAADEAERLAKAYGEYGRSRIAGASGASGDAISTARDIIKQFEGMSNEAYPDYSYRNGQKYNSGWRAGYGSDTGTDFRTGSTYPIREGMTISTADAEADLNRRIQGYFDTIIAAIGETRFSGLTADQKGSIASLLHNYGAGELSSSGDLRAVLAGLQAGNNQQTADAIGALSTQNNGVNAGRRGQEAAAFGGASQRVQDVNELTDAGRALIAAQEESNRQAGIEADLAQQYGATNQENIAAITKERVEQELLNKAKEAGIDVDKALTESGSTYRQEIERLAEAAGAAAQAEVDATQKREAALARTQVLEDTVGQISQGLASAFVDAIRGAEDFGSAVSNVFSDVLAQIAQLIIQQTIYNALARALGLKPQTGGILDALGLALPGFAKGGYTGDGPAGQVAGVVHKGEHVFDADTTRRIGVPALTALAGGGSLVGSPFAGSEGLSGMAGGGGSSSSPTVNVEQAPIEVYPILSDAALGRMISRPGTRKVVIDLVEREGFSRG